jgi:hypothetical protein
VALPRHRPSPAARPVGLGGRLGGSLGELEIHAASAHRLARLAGRDGLALIERLAQRAAQVRVHDRRRVVRDDRVREATVEVERVAGGAVLGIRHGQQVLATLVRLMTAAARELGTVLDRGDPQHAWLLLQILDALEIHLEMLGVVQLHLCGVAHLGLLIEADALGLAPTFAHRHGELGMLAEVRDGLVVPGARLSLVLRSAWHCVQWRSPIWPAARGRSARRGRWRSAG